MRILMPQPRQRTNLPRAWLGTARMRLQTMLGHMIRITLSVDTLTSAPCQPAVQMSARLAYHRLTNASTSAPQPFCIDIVTSCPGFQAARLLARSNNAATLFPVSLLILPHVQYSR